MFYRTVSGHCPVEEFLDGLSGKQAQKATWVLKLVEELDVVPPQYLKKMIGTEKLWEIRVRLASNTLRFLAFMDGSRLVILAHAFHKKTQKTPQQDIRTAEDRRRDYFRRKGDE